MDNSISPALNHALITRRQVARWRREARYPVGRIGVFFGTRTAIFFSGDVDPLDFDFYPLATFPDGILLLERGVSAYRAYRELHPDAEIIF